MARKIVIWGAGGHAKVLREFIKDLGYELVAVFDNNKSIINPFNDIPLYFGEQGARSWRQGQGDEQIRCLVAIGGTSGRVRREIQFFLETIGIEPTVAIHPTAFVARNAVLEKGSQVLAHATVGTDVEMGEACIINTAASVDHESVLGDGVHVAPGATLAGCVTVGSYSTIGVGAVVLPRVVIGSNTIIGAGAVVTRDVPDHKVAYGNPARIQRENN